MLEFDLIILTFINFIRIKSHDLQFNLQFGVVQPS